MIPEEFTEHVKEKKELKNINKKYLEKTIKKYFEENKKIKEELERNNYNKKSAEYKKALKEIRARLRRSYGMFKTKEQGIKKHLSSKERANHYKELYKKIFEKEKPKKILDLGCGLNPLSYELIPGKPEYYCCDIDEEEIKTINEYFKEKKIKGEAKIIDLTNEEERKEYFKKTKADTILMFKIIDTLEEQERNITKKILKEIRTTIKPERIIISFPTTSLGGKKIRKGEEENWFSKHLKKEKLEWEKTEIPGEEFWIIRTREANT